MFKNISKLAGTVALAVSAMSFNAQAADATLRGASLFDNDHACLLYTSPSPRD